MEEVISRLFADVLTSNRPLILAVGLAACAAAHRSIHDNLPLSWWAVLLLSLTAAACSVCAVVLMLVLLQRRSVKR